MKRMTCLILVLSFLLSGCGFFGNRIKDPVTFYYLCDKYQEELCCVIVSEEREASGHTDDLSYLLALYLMGPASDEMLSPLPSGTQIISQQEGDHIHLELSGIHSSLTDIEYSLACACLTLTCLDITGAKEVTIRSGDRTKTLNEAALTLYDTTPQTTPMEENP